MAIDIDGILQGWEFKPGVLQARLIRAQDEREVIQLRLDLGILQMETVGRPDGQKPDGHFTYFEFLQSQARSAGKKWSPSPDQCVEADREFIQFYHRRVAWLALHQFDRALVDSDHTLAFMDFLKEHSPSDEFTMAHERYRGFVLFHRTQAAAAKHLEAEDPEQAIDELRSGQRRILEFFAEHGLEENADEDAMLRQLRDSEKSLRQNHAIEVTLAEQLDQAVDAEDYELAARLRDQLRNRVEEHRTAPRSDP